MILFFILSVYLPIDSWQNELAEEMQVRGVHFTRFPSMRPYDIAELNLVDYPFFSDRLWLPNLSARAHYDTINVLRVKPSVYYDWSGFSICVQPVFKFGDDSLPPYRVFNVSDRELFSADYERAYAKYAGKNFGLFIGRERFSIGPSPRYNLLLSGYSALMDWFSYSMQSNKLRFSFFLTRMDDWYTKPQEYVGDTITQYIDARRYLTVKRLDFSPYPWLNFGLSEATVFGGEDYTLQLYHLNPVVFVQAYQYNWDDDVNFFLGFDTKVFFNNLAFYAALLIDDFQLETDNNGEPHHWGINVGTEIADIVGIKNSFWVLEYTAVSRYTYCHFVPYQRYQYLETSIGSPYGPDYDEIFTKLTYHITKTIDLFAQIAYLRKGEGDISTLWPIPEYPREPGTFFPEGNLLSGTVQKSIDSGIGARYFLQNQFAVELYVGFLHLDDAKHIIGAGENSLVIRLQVDVLNF
jgi:hypothetical protein